ncbi:MAG TPA: hypothetical protein VFJ19_11655 [Nocardioidaceae bacterium]|nr:hypothetical protein [Nocardioidaceae bacterium]
MLDGLSYVAIVASALVTVGAGVLFAVRRSRPRRLDTAAWVLEVILLIRAVAGAGTLLHGVKAAEPAPYLGYLIASVCVMPVALGALTEDRERWSNAVVAVAALALAVISVRLLMTWGGGRG